MMKIETTNKRENQCFSWLFFSAALKPYHPSNELTAM
jgi:hypothetical protein